MFGRTPQLLFKRLVQSHHLKSPNTIPTLTNSSSQWWFSNKNIIPLFKVQLYSFSSFQQNIRTPLRQTEYQEEELDIFKYFQPEKLPQRRQVMEKYLQCKDLTPSDITSISEVLSFLAASHYADGNQDKGHRYLKEDEDLYKEAGIIDTISVANNYYLQGYFYLEKNNLTDAKHYLDEAIRICRLLGDDKKARNLLVQCDIYFARMYELQNDQDKALELYHSVIERADHLNKGELQSIMGSIFHSMGVIYKSRNDIEKTVEYWTKALEISVKEAGANSRRTFLSVYQIARFLYSHDQYQRALPFMKQSLQIALQNFPNEDNPDIASLYTKLGNIYIAASDYIKALESLKKAIQIFEKLPLQEFADDLFSCYLLLAGIYLRERRLREALEALQKVLEYSEINPQDKKEDIEMARESIAEIEAVLKVENEKN